ncbi:Armadillo-type fold [Pseudocohnilembus persalinus]|uniref:Armadillo-type fold n=1 Tax=Pseudocohnilembus persalinus TaxID=266149 RepID=A0A0V0QY77_PSEPJ|nr:Armadillo-type fold [Pseudocohnilembus persalinus]|eukprot:KRX07299.1 Armadillo-type fold [Pseudocohnilembus persalinus]
MQGLNNNTLTSTISKRPPVQLSRDAKGNVITRVRGNSLLKEKPIQQQLDEKSNIKNKQNSAHQSLNSSGSSFYKQQGNIPVNPVNKFTSSILNRSGSKGKIPLSQNSIKKLQKIPQEQLVKAQEKLGSQFSKQKDQNITNSELNSQKSTQNSQQLTQISQIKQKIQSDKFQQEKLQNQKPKFEDLKQDDIEDKPEFSQSMVNFLKKQSHKQPLKIQKADKAVSQQYEKDFNQVIKELKQFAENKQQAEDDQMKELMGRVSVLILDWEKQQDLTQKMCMRETLLQGLIFILKDIENPKIRIRSIKQVINLMRNIGFKYIFSEKDSKELILPPEALYEFLLQVLKESQKLTQKGEIQHVLLEENMTLQYFELLSAIKENISSKDLNLKSINILQQLYSIMKNETSNEQSRKKYFIPQNLVLVTSFLHFFQFDEKNTTEKVSEKLFELYITITALIRNLAIDVNCTIAYHKYRVIDKLTKSIELYPHINDLMLNTVRILSKVSLNRECSIQMFENQHFIKNILGFYKTYKQNLYIIIRISFILANLTAFIQDIRTFIYFQMKGFQDIYLCLDYYTNKENSQKNQQNSETDKMNITNTGWDFKQLQKENDVEALIKIIRLIANLLTVEDIGQDLIKNKNMYYKDLIKKLKQLIHGKDIQLHQELIVCSLSCLANLTFYEKQPLPTTDFEFKNSKLELIVSLGNYIMQIDNEDICCEALRVISNLSRHKDLITNMIKFKIVEGVIVILDSNSKEIVYYALGALINLLNNDDIKRLFGVSIIEGVLEILKDCNIEDQEILITGFKCMANIIDVNSQLDKQYIDEIEIVLERIGAECDTLIEQSQDLDQINLINEIFDMRGVINQIYNNMPEESVHCPVPNCGRKFKNQEDLQAHVKRRHNL